MNAVIQKRKPGNSGLELPTCEPDCMGLNFFYGDPLKMQEPVSLLRAATERGVSFSDIAEMYGSFTNEEIAGEALVPFRGNLEIAAGLA